VSDNTLSAYLENNGSPRFYSNISGIQQKKSCTINQIKAGSKKIHAPENEVFVAFSVSGMPEN